jgi:hypothetical protein
MPGCPLPMIESPIIGRASFFAAGTSHCRSRYLLPSCSSGTDANSLRFAYGEHLRGGRSFSANELRGDDDAIKTAEGLVVGSFADTRYD